MNFSILCFKIENRCKYQREALATTNNEKQSVSVTATATATTTNVSDASTFITSDETDAGHSDECEVNTMPNQRNVSAKPTSTYTERKMLHASPDVSSPHSRDNEDESNVLNSSSKSMRRKKKTIKNSN